MSGLLRILVVVFVCLVPLVKAEKVCNASVPRRLLGHLTSSPIPRKISVSAGEGERNRGYAIQARSSSSMKVSYFHIATLTLQKRNAWCMHIYSYPIVSPEGVWGSNSMNIITLLCILDGEYYTAFDCREIALQQ